MGGGDRLAVQKWGGRQQTRPGRFHPNPDGDAYPDSDSDAYSDLDGDALAAASAAPSTPAASAIAHRDTNACAGPSPAGNRRGGLGPMGLYRPGHRRPLGWVASEAQEVKPWSSP
jgi:hypothetical protein